jgi:hypothetical protein
MSSKRRRGSRDRSMGEEGERRREEDDGGGGRRRRGSREPDDDARGARGDDEDREGRRRGRERGDKEELTPRKKEKGALEETPSKQRRVSFDGETKNQESPDKLKNATDETSLLSDKKRPRRSEVVVMGCCETISYMFRLEDSISSMQNWLGHTSHRWGAIATQVVFFFLFVVLLAISSNFGSQCFDGSFTTPCPKDGCNVNLRTFTVVEGAVGIVFLFFTMTFTTCYFREPRDPTTSTVERVTALPKPEYGAWVVSMILLILFVFRATWLAWGLTLVIQSSPKSCVSGNGSLYIISLLYIIVVLSLLTLLIFWLMISNSLPSQLRHKTSEDLEAGQPTPKSRAQAELPSVKALSGWKRLIKGCTIMYVMNHTHTHYL